MTATRQLKELPSLVGAVGESLEAFRLRQQQANATSARLANEFNSFSEALNGVVTALQFHDITRQQIEHVVEALVHLAGDGDSGSRTRRLSADEVAVMEVQRRQLVGAAEAFAASVERVKRELGQIASRGREMAGEANTLLGLAGGQQSSFFDQMERCFAGVLAAVAGCTALNDETANAMGELQRTVAGLQDCIADIRTIALGINRLALNSAIEAVRLGAAGEPLGVVAGAMQTLRADVEMRSDDTENLLAALSGAVLSMIQPAAQTPESDQGYGHASVTDELRTRIDELHGSSEHSLTRSQQISAAAATLCAEVQLASESFTVGAQGHKILDRCCGVLQRIVVESGVQTTGATSGMKHLAARYTMQSERDVHQMATGQVNLATSPEEESRVTVPVPTGDFGDNVELF